MTNGIKIAYIGAGSFRFSTGLFRNICAAKELFPMEICLVDIDPASLALMTNILNKMVKKARANVKVTSTTNQRDALENADFVYKSISVGMQESEWIDIHMPQKYGIPQNTGDTCGPGGLFRGLRCVQPVYSIAKNMKELCPKAILLNYTNPQSTIVMAARRVDPELQFIGLCHGLFSGMKVVQGALNEKGFSIKDWHDLDFSYGGVNHFIWLTKLLASGQDVYPLLRENWKSFMNLRGFSFDFYLLGKYGYLPLLEGRHVAEFMPEYYNYFNHESRPFGITRLRDVNRVHLERTSMYFIFRQWARWSPVPGPTKRGEKAIDMTLDCLNNDPVQHVVNLPNKNFIPNLPEGAIVEIPGYFKDGKMEGIEVGSLPDAIADLVRPHAEQQFLTVDAGLGNDPDLVIKAMLHDPMCKFIEDDDRIEDLTWNMLYHEQKWLPPEWKEWIPKREELMTRKHWVDEKELKGKGNARVCKYPINDHVKKKAYLGGS
ncbi:MAG TPA: hypothetical protein VKM55_23740 [Candidatus Lokiarchaeia archaeon]|nr:hypothetical protein [Candidatus Lokiarchaeia archaeon]